MSNHGPRRDIEYGYRRDQNPSETIYMSGSSGSRGGCCQGGCGGCCQSGGGGGLLGDLDITTLGALAVLTGIAIYLGWRLVNAKRRRRGKTRRFQWHADIVHNVGAEILSRLELRAVLLKKHLP